MSREEEQVSSRLALSGQFITVPDVRETSFSRRAMSALILLQLGCKILLTHYSLPCKKRVSLWLVVVPLQ